MKEAILSLVCIICIQNQAFAQSMDSVLPRVGLHEIRQPIEGGYWLSSECSARMQALTKFRSSSVAGVETLSTDLAGIPNTAGTTKITDPGMMNELRRLTAIARDYCKSAFGQLETLWTNINRGPIDPAIEEPVE